MLSLIPHPRHFLRLEFLANHSSHIVLFCFSSRAGKTYRCISVKIQVMREEEFAPVKNANGATYDTPDSAKLMLLRLHSRWVVAAGGFLTHSVPLYMTGNFPYW
jgi:hypothetical protein